MSLLNTIAFVAILLLFFENYDAIFGLEHLKFMKNKQLKPTDDFTVESSGVIDPDTILHLHNEYREKLFDGPDGKPKATFMYKLEWSYRLANNAELLARQCECSRSSLLESSYDFIENFPKQGIIADCSKTKETFHNLILSWCHESEFLTPENENRLKNFAKNKFAQIASGKNYAIGCSYVICNNINKEQRHVYVCNYEIGIFPGDVIYDIKEFPKGKCKHAYSRQYPKLCLHRKPVPPLLKPLTINTPQTKN